MAKDTKQGPASMARIRVFVAEVECSDATLQDAIKSVEAAVHKTFQPKVVVHRLSSGASANAVQPVNPDTDHQSDDAEIVDAPEQHQGAEENAEKRPKSSSAGKARKGVSYEIDKNLNLLPPGQKSFAAFVEEKGPDGQQELVAVAVYYLKKILQQPKVNVSQIYTCFKEVGAEVPTDLGLVVRNVDSRKGWIDAKDKDDIAATTPGENFVEHKLPRPKSK
jgi:hypothetical protein